MGSSLLTHQFLNEMISAFLFVGISYGYGVELTILGQVDMSN